MHADNIVSLKDTKASQDKDWKKHIPTVLIKSEVQFLYTLQKTNVVCFAFKHVIEILWSSSFNL